METFRDAVERGLLGIDGVRALTEREARYIDDFKDGTFGLSYLGLLLYCNGRNPRGLSSAYPNGMVYFDGENLFGVGVYRREHEKEKGHLMVVAPRGLDPVGAVNRFAKMAVEAAPELKGQMLFARFLNSEHYRNFLCGSFLPAHEEPWHTEALAEDETYNHSVVRLSEVIDVFATERSRNAFHRFGNFLKRYGLGWEVKEFSADEAKEIVGDHFKMLEIGGKRVGSVPEDYWNVLEAGKKGRFAAIMSIRKGEKEIPTSVFVGEKVSPQRMAVYCCISRRDEAYLAKELGLPPELRGFTALSTYAFLHAFKEIRKTFPEVEEVHLGGSETADLNAFKRRLGARNEPTYWVVKKL